MFSENKNKVCLEIKVTQMVLYKYCLLFCQVFTATSVDLLLLYIYYCIFRVPCVMNVSIRREHARP